MIRNLKVMTILGTRPEIIRLAQTIKACERAFDHILVHTGQNWDYSLNQVFFENLGLGEPDHYLSVVGEDLGETMGNIVAKSYRVLLEERPDALLVLGDTNSALSAISAKRLKIPIFHMEAGNRCFDQRVPEEINRKIVDHVSDINLPYTEHSRRYLLDEGFRKEHIIVTGSPMPEVLGAHSAAIDGSAVLSDLELEKGKYFVVSMHREENVDDEATFLSLVEALNNVGQTYDMPIVFSTHPRTKKHIEKRGIRFHPLVRNLTPLGFHDYNCLQKNSFCVLSDSGTLSEESAILGFNGVLIRTSTERPEVLDVGSVVIGGVTTEDVVRSIAIAVEPDLAPSRLPDDYRDSNVSAKVVRAIQSYVPIINKRTWDKRRT